LLAGNTQGCDVCRVHEYSLVLSLIERVKVEALAHKAQAVHRVELSVGELSGVEPDLLASAFEIVRVGTLAEDAALSVALVQARWQCPSCGIDLDSRQSLNCPTCAKPARLIQGAEIILEKLELEI
jgi:hydrogenase nickel incorporation protein HypA/HybF